jgi:surfeit locus 1 family protein
MSALFFDGSTVRLQAQIGRRQFSASVWMTLLCAVGVVAFVQLGRWQWHRAAQKEALDARFIAGAEHVTELGSASTAALPRYQRVRVAGRLDGAHQFLLDNLSHNGRAGVEVLTPLTLDDGRTLLLNRGWVPWETMRSQLPDSTLKASGPVVLSGRLDELPVTGLALGHAAPANDAAWPKLTSFPHMGELGDALGKPLEPRQVLLDAGEPNGYVRDWQVSGLDATRHMAYALQWWTFAGLAVTLYLVLNFRKTTP